MKKLALLAMFCFLSFTGAQATGFSYNLVQTPEVLNRSVIFKGPERETSKITRLKALEAADVQENQLDEKIDRITERYSTETAFNSLARLLSKCISFFFSLGRV